MNEDERRDTPRTDEELHETSFTEGASGAASGSAGEPPGEAQASSAPEVEVRLSDLAIGFLGSALFGPKPDGDGGDPPDPEAVGAAFVETARGWLDRLSFDDALELYMAQHGADVSRLNPLWLVAAGGIALVGTAFVYYRVAHPKREEEGGDDATSL